MPQEEPERGNPLGPLDWLRRLPHEAAASSDRLGWVGLDIPQLRAAVGAVDAELKAGGAGGRLAAESLANELGHRLAAPSAESEAT